MISAIGLAVGLGLLIFLTIRGLSILIGAPIAALLVALSSGLALLPPLAATDAPDFATAYMRGFTGFFADWFLMFLLGAIFGELMQRSGAADSIAASVLRRLGPQRAVLAVVAAAAVLTYGGVSVFIVAFSVYPMAVSLFRSADLPRRFIPGALAFGSVTFTMTSAGSPEIQNLIPMQFLGTSPYAAWEVSIIVAIIMAAAGQVWLSRMVRRAVARGERFEARADDDAPVDTASLPHPLLSLVPLVVVLGVFLLTQYPARFGLAAVFGADGLDKWGLVVALGGGVLAAALIAAVRRADFGQALSTGASGAVIAIANTCAVVGFGAIARLSPAFTDALAAVQALPGDPLIGAALAVTLIAGLTGSASGGQTIALPLIAPGYIEAGANPGELHRVVAIASGCLDSLPHNGYVVTTIRAICGETHRAAYGPVGALTVVLPMLGLAVALVLFAVF